MHSAISLNFDSHFREGHHTLVATFVEELISRTADWLSGAPADTAAAPVKDGEWTDSGSGVHTCTDHPLTSLPSKSQSAARLASIPSFDVIEFEEMYDDRPPLTHWGINE